MLRQYTTENIDVLATISEQSNQAFFIYDIPSNAFTHLNAAYGRIWAKIEQNSKGNPAALLKSVHPDDQQHVFDSYQELLRGLPTKTIEFRLVTDEQAIKWISLTAYLIRQPDNDQARLITGFAADITNSKENTFVLQKFNAKKNSTLEILAHDLTGPLATVQNLVYLLARQTGKYNDPEAKGYIELIQQTCQRSITLIRELINQEFEESAEVEMKLERVDLVVKIGEIIRNYMKKQQDIGRFFSIASNEEKVYATVDVLKFMQVINNLISNAIKFTRAGGAVVVRIEHSENRILISVQDNGIGIPVPLQPYLFDEFTKARRPGLNGEPTVGLGMATIKRIVELHKGRIWFESEEGIGTTFYIELSNSSC